MIMLPALPSGLPSVHNAKLPKMYEGAKEALAECSRIDECADWANKAEALASYAKQAGDESLRKTADRIQARAIRRCGELLKEIRPAKNQHEVKVRASGGAPTSRTQAAKDAGLSRDQRVAALPAARCQGTRYHGGRCVQSGRAIGDLVLCAHHTAVHVPADGRYWNDGGRARR